ELPCRANEVAGDQRPGQGRHQRVLALVQPVGPNGRPDEVPGELLPAVGHQRLDRARSEGPGPDLVEVAALAHVGGQGNHLDAHFLRHPPDGHRGVKTPAVRQHHSLGHLLPLSNWSISRELTAEGAIARRNEHHRPARAPSRRATRSPPARSVATTRTVSSPATVPRMSGSPARSTAEPTTWAEPGGVRSTTRFIECETSTTQSPSTRFRCSSGARRSLAASGMTYTRSPPGRRAFTAPISSRSRDTVAWVATTPSAASRSTTWAWLDTACCSRMRATRCWRCGLASRTSPAPAEEPQQ